jgi:gluconate 2-dehydrogenase gamma chain
MLVYASSARLPLRRQLLVGFVAMLTVGPASAAVVSGHRPWSPDAGKPPIPTTPGIWQFFTPEEGATIEALVDRLIPPDPQTPGGKDAGVAVFIDRQLAGPYGHSAGLYMRPPFHDGTPEQGPQSPLTPAQRYRVSLLALGSHCRIAFAGKPFAALSHEHQDKILTKLENGSLSLKGASGKGFFEILLKNTREGFFADPLYGGNRNMVGWKMIGFPGARYDYRDWISRHNERYPHPPVGLLGRPEWSGNQT